MANRVNIKFVVILSAVLIVISIGVAFLAAQVVLKSAEDHIRLGDTAMQAGDYRVAASHYSKAVANDQLNKEYLRKWIGALERNVPENDQLLNEKFFQDLVPARMQLAKADPDDPSDQISYLDLNLDILERTGGYRADAFTQLTADARTFIDHHRAMRPDDQSWWPLRRYNAIATALAVGADTSPTLAAVEAAIADGRAALEANPDDARAAVSVYDLLVYRAAELERQQLPGAIEAREAIDAFVAETIDRTTPGSDARMSAEITRLADRMRAMLQELKKSMTAERAAIAMGQRAGELVPALDALFDRINQSETAPSNPTIRRLMNIERGIDPRGGLVRSLGVLERAIAKRPEDVELFKQRAVLETITGDVDSAIATYQRIGEFVPQAIDLESVLRKEYRIDSLYQLAELLYTAAERTDSADERAKLLTDVRQVRDRLAERVSSNNPQLQLIDARIALTEGKTVEAQAMLERLNQQTQFTFEEGLWLAGASAAQNRQPGLARTRFRQLVEMQPRAVRYRRALAEMELAVGNAPAAIEQLRVALELEPTNPDVISDLEELEVLHGGRAASDPVEGALIRAKQIADGTGQQLGNPKAAIESLEQAIAELGPDPRLIANLARQQVLAGNIEEAQRAAEIGLEAHPEDEDMLMLSQAVNTGDRGDIIKYFMRQLQGDPGDVAVATYITLQRLGEPESAAEALEEAIELAPDNAVVLEAQLVRAIQAEDFDQATTIADRAARANADEVGGATFRARVQQARGETEAAISTLRGATDRYPNSAGLWRLLGLMQTTAGQPLDAVRSFDRALEIRPDMVAVINAKIRTLLSTGRNQEALDFKRRNEFVGRTDDEFVELHLLIEGEHGDAGLARQQREQRAQQNPEDLPNLAQLAGLYIRDGQFDRASQIVEMLSEKVEDPRSLITLRATLRFEQGDIEGARSVFATDIATSRPDSRADSYLRLYSFLNERGRVSEAITTLVQALPWQQADRMLVDKTLGDTLMSLGNFEGANASYTRIRNAGAAGEDSIWEQRRIETLIRLGRNEEASEALAALPDSERTLSTRLLEADLTIRQGDYARARSLLDEIVAENPDNALVYVKRAEAMSDAPDLQRDRLLDLNKALELNPRFWQAYRARAAVLSSMQRTDEAIADLRKAIELNPSLDTVRINLIEYLVTQGRTNEALEIARDAMTLKPRDAQLRDRLGLVFAQGGRVREATQMYRSALELDPTSARAVRVLDLLLNETPPRTIDAENLLSLPIMTSLIQEDGGLRLMRARVYHLQGRSDAALRESVEAYRALRPIARDMLVWFNFVEGMINDRSGTLAFLDRFAAEPGTSQWARLFRGLLLIRSDDTRAEGISMLEQHAGSTADSEVAFTAWRALGSRAYESEDFSKAVEYWQKALDRRPEDTTVLNNIAYTFTARMNDPAKAIELATKAANLAPNDSDVLHTLGVSLLRNGQSERAINPLERSRNAAQSPMAWVTASVHLAESLQDVGRTDEAKEVVQAIQSRMDDPSVLNDVLREDYNRLLAALGMN